jgi:hypothetical protein
MAPKYKYYMEEQKKGNKRNEKKSKNKEASGGIF